MKTFTYVALVLSIFLTCMQPAKGQNPVIIDVDKALQKPQNIKLSQFIDRAEMIELEGKRGAYIQGLYWAHIGTKYIMVGDKQPNVILLFTRNGKFLRQIGSQGKGPGEYTVLNAAAMSPDEKCIIVSDFTARKLISYSPEGKLLKEITLTKESPSRIIDEISFIDNHTFAANYRKPILEVENYSRIQIYNTDLEPLKTLIPLTDPRILSLKGMIQSQMVNSPEGIVFFNQLENILYLVGANQNAKQIAKFVINKNPLTADLFQEYNRPEQRALMAERTYLWSVYNIPGLIFSNGYSSGKPFLIGYDKVSKTTFSIPIMNPCYKGVGKRPSIENDIFGIEPVYLEKFQVGSDFYITQVSFSETSEYRDLECLKKLSLTQPEIRDRIVKITENQTGEENIMLVLLHVKK